jgi:hypothetical protein
VIHEIFLKIKETSIGKDEQVISIKNQASRRNNLLLQNLRKHYERKISSSQCGNAHKIALKMSISPKKIYLYEFNGLPEELKKDICGGDQINFKKDPCLDRQNNFSPMCGTAQTLRSISNRLFRNLHQYVFLHHA